MCDIEPVEPWNVPLPERETSSLSKRMNTVRLKAGKKDPFQVVHLSDLHVDPEYAVSPQRL